MDDQGTEREGWERTKKIARWFAICIMPVGLYLNWANGNQWWPNFIITVAWCNLVASQIIEYFTAKDS